MLGMDTDRPSNHVPKCGSTWIQATLSLFVGFQLFTVLLVPNAQNWLGMKVAPWLEPYVNFFELTNAWSFFAPEPGPPPVFVEFEKLDRKGESLGLGRWPEVHDPFWLRERQNRRIAAAEYMMATELRAEKMMLQYLCRVYPEAGSFRIWRIMYSVPDFQDVASGKRRIGDDVGLERRLVSHSFCEERRS